METQRRVRVSTTSCYGGVTLKDIDGIKYVQYKGDKKKTKKKPSDSVRILIFSLFLSQ